MAGVFKREKCACWKQNGKTIRRSTDVSIGKGKTAEQKSKQMALRRLLRWKRRPKVVLPEVRYAIPHFGLRSSAVWSVRTSRELTRYWYAGILNDLQESEKEGAASYLLFGIAKGAGLWYAGARHR